MARSDLLAAYLTRIGVTAPGSPDLDTLRRLHEAHVAVIPFENLDILLGRGIDLDLHRLGAKLVDAQRGGYCFEQNTLFLAMLRELGFTAEAMEARVRVGTATLRPRTHMVLSVAIEGREWLADVGFGGEGPLEPVPMRGADPALSTVPVHRVVDEGPLRVLQMGTAATGWTDQYAFRPEAAHPVDFEMANWFTSTHPRSPFVRTLTAQRTTRGVRHVLRYPALTEMRASGVRTRDIARAELLPVLREVFLIDLPDDTVFPAIDAPAARALV